MSFQSFSHHISYQLSYQLACFPIIFPYLPIIFPPFSYHFSFCTSLPIILSFSIFSLFFCHHFPIIFPPFPSFPDIFVPRNPAIPRCWGGSASAARCLQALATELLRRAEAVAAVAPGVRAAELVEALCTAAWWWLKHWMIIPLMEINNGTIKN